MKIERISINKIKPYGKNAKKHPKEQIEQIKRSIEEFGNNDPIAIDEKNVIIEGHGRYEALKALGYEEVEVIKLTHLSDEQKKAYILAHNQLTLNSGFDLDILNSELDEIINIDMSEFGFDISLPSGDEYFGDERERTNDAYNLDKYDEKEVTGFYDMPIIKACNHVPTDIISFNYMLTSKEYNKGIHFYIDDYQFERVWQRPEFYIEKMREFDCCFTPDFSLYLDMPMSMKIWNTYRSKFIGQQMQKAGIKVIPTLSWAEKETFDFAFDGYEEGGTVSVSTIGVKRNDEQGKIWFEGMDEAMRRINPKTVIVYGGDIGYDFKCDVKYFDNKAFRHNEKN